MPCPNDINISSTFRAGSASNPDHFSREACTCALRCAYHDTLATQCGNTQRGPMFSPHSIGGERGPQELSFTHRDQLCPCLSVSLLLTNHYLQSPSHMYTHSQNKTVSFCPAAILLGSFIGEASKNPSIPVQAASTYRTMVATRPPFRNSAPVQSPSQCGLYSSSDPYLMTLKPSWPVMSRSYPVTWFAKAYPRLPTMNNEHGSGGGGSQGHRVSKQLPTTTSGLVPQKRLFLLASGRGRRNHHRCICSAGRSLNIV